MTQVEKIFALQRVSPFDRLYDAELTLVAEVARDRRYPPGETVVSERAPLQSLYVVVQGGVYSADGTPAPRVVGIHSLLFDLPFTDTLRASPEEGAVCLVIGKSHFHTIVNACSELVIGLLEGPPLLLPLCRRAGA
ncbi:MAG: cyclic nucleotide-binding domain-containing protein [Candidatus Latescibacterota bacterium]